MVTLTPAAKGRSRHREAGEIVVRNISKDKVANSNHQLPIISISDRYSSGVSIPGSKAGRHVLYLEFFAGDHWDDKEQCITREHAKKIREFWLGLPEGTKEVLVNCGEGRIRSYTVCEVLWRHFENVAYHEGSGDHDRHTYHTLRRYLDELEEEAAVAAAASAEEPTA